MQVTTTIRRWPGPQPRFLLHCVHRDGCGGRWRGGGNCWRLAATRHLPPIACQPRLRPALHGPPPLSRAPPLRHRHLATLSKGCAEGGAEAVAPNQGDGAKPHSTVCQRAGAPSCKSVQAPGPLGRARRHRLASRILSEVLALSAGGSLKPEGGRTRECVLFIGTPSVTLALSRRVVARGWMPCWALLYIKKRLKLITSPIPTFSLPHPTLPSFPPSPRTSAFLSSSKFRSLIICSLTASRPLALSLSSRPLALCSLDLSPSRSLALSRYLFIRVIICVVASDWRKLPLRF